jgi:hypothetical protein
LRTYPYVKAYGQHWIEIAIGDGSMKYFSRRSGYVIDARGGVIQSTSLQQYSLNDGANQHWIIGAPRADGSVTVTAAGPPISIPGESSSGATHLSWFADPHDIHAVAAGARVLLMDINLEGGDPAYMTYWWSKQIEDDGIYPFRIASAIPGKKMVLDVPSSTAQNLFQVQVFPDKGDIQSGQMNQAWEIRQIDADHFEIVSMCNGQFLAWGPDDDNLRQTTSESGLDTLWRIPMFSAGTPEIPGPIIPERDESFRLTVGVPGSPLGHLAPPGQAVLLRPDSGGAASQQWLLVSHVV